ncbi:MAG: homoserine dehydrogenase [Deltaproteobacteria bacterium]|nr:homoserine dehydrogenase [Deltaproteobacteria bacterium]
MAQEKNRKRVKIGLLGSGTVGGAIQDFIFKDQKRPDLDLEIVKIFTRHPEQKRWYSTYPKLFTTNPLEVVEHPEAEIIIEALGFQNDQQISEFKDYIIRAFKSGKGLVTSDKAVLARHGREIWDAAARYGQELRFEACVGGGIPIIRSLTESFAAEEPTAIYGIVNGTCNYILSEMAKSGKSYRVALREAQECGYAETNPESDISGSDAEAKLILLAAVTFGVHVQPGKLWRQGINKIHAMDFLYAAKKASCTIKHLAVARSVGASLQAFVSPVLVPRSHFLSSIDGATNAIFFKGRRSEDDASREQPESRDWNYVFVGPGAGGGATAVAVLGDVMDLARGRRQRVTGPPSLVAPGVLGLHSPDEILASFYIRFVVTDRAGIVGDICQTFGERDINISEVWQLSHSDEELRRLAAGCGKDIGSRKILPFVITLEPATVKQVKQALEIVGQQDYILLPPIWFPIWTD